jgi:hypothetical protein
MPRFDFMEPWGDDAHSALRWSFARLSRSDVLPTALDGYLKSDRPPGAITRMDAIAQAAIVRDIALGHDPLHRAYLTAYYLPAPTRERAAGGGLCWADRFYERRLEAVHAVAWWLMGMAGTGSHRVRGYQELVMQYVLGQPSHRRLREALKIKDRKVTDVRSKAYQQLDELHQKAVSKAHERLAAARLFEDAA